MKKLITPLTLKDLMGIKAGEKVLLSGTIYTARDAAQKRLLAEKTFPSFLKNQILYYAGPAPAPKGFACGSIGPTTSSRMDAYTPAILEKSNFIMLIGKGQRGKAVKEAMVGKAVYMAAVGGAGALAAQCVKRCEAVLYPDLGAEAVYKLEIEDFPLFTAIDWEGNDIYDRKK